MAASLGHTSHVVSSRLSKRFQGVFVESRWVSFRLILLEDGTMTNPYPAEFRERALRMLAEARPDHPSDFAAANHVAGRLGVNPETLRL